MMNFSLKMLPFRILPINTAVLAIFIPEKTTTFPAEFGDNWRFEWDLRSKPLFAGFSVYTAAQICCWMGYDDLVVVGWDMKVGDHVFARDFTEKAFDRQLEGAKELAKHLCGKVRLRVVGDVGHPLEGILPVCRTEDL